VGATHRSPRLCRCDLLCPASGAVELVHRGLPLDEIEDSLPKSAAYRQATRILTVCRPQVKGRPLTPLHGGHVALCAVTGLLDGEDRQIATWGSVKVTDCSEELEEDGTIIGRERERLPTSSRCYMLSGKPSSCAELLRLILRTESARRGSLRLCDFCTS
jgi:hypothetical protein